MIDVPMRVKYLDNYNMKEWGPLKYAYDYDAGFDLRAAIEKQINISSIPYHINKNFGEYAPNYTQVLIKCGVKFEIPNGYQIEVRPRSGLAAKYGITVVNSPGTIDSGYRGEMMVILANMGSMDFTIYPGDRIAQAVLMPVYRADFIDVGDGELDESVRSIGGCGSSGVK